MTRASPPPRPAPQGLRFAIRKLMRQSNQVALATALAGAEARPYVSLATVATDIDGAPLLLLSRLADHTRNIEADARVSLLFDGTEGYANPQQGPRVTIMGRVERCDEDRVRHRFLARHPAASFYAGFGDFAFHRVTVESAHWVGGFARAQWVAEPLLCPAPLAEQFAAAEQGVLDHMNADHAEAVTAMAKQLLKRRGGGWRMVSLDPDGCDLARGQTVVRLSFDAPLGDAGEIRPALVELVGRARQAK